MKPVSFQYHAPATVKEAVDLLGALPNARLLAGGQSLVPMLNLRAATPDHIIDLGGVAGLNSIRESPTTLRIGAMTTQRAIERSDLIRSNCPLLTETVLHVGHQQTRNRGTLGGSLCHLDPGAELPVIAAALEAVLTVEGPSGSRTLCFDEFPAGYLTTTLEPDEVLTEIEIPKAGADEGYAFLEFNQRPADFAVVCVAVSLAFEGARVRRARIAIGGVDYAPIRLTEAENSLRGETAGAEAFARAAAVAAALRCEGDEVSPADFRQHLAGVLTGRALSRAAERAGRT